jgi:hypothetical protein
MLFHVSTINVFRGFPPSQPTFCVAAQVPCYTICFSCRLTNINLKIPKKITLSQCYHCMVIIMSSNFKTHLKYSFFPTAHSDSPPYLLIFPKLYIASSLPLSEGRAGPGKFQRRKFSVSFLIINSVVLIRFLNSLLILFYSFVIILHTVTNPHRRQ